MAINISILYETQNIMLNLKNIHTKIRVKDLILNIKRTLKIEDNYDFVLLDGNKKLEENEEIKFSPLVEMNTDLTSDSSNSSNINHLTFYLVEKKNYKKKKHEETRSKKITTPVEEYIMKVTDAKDKLVSTNRNVKGRRFYDENFTEFEMFEQLIASSENSNMNASERLASIRNLLTRPVLNTTGTNSNSNIESSMRSRPYISRSQVVQPDENLVNNLKEMGFEEDRIKRALIATGNELTAATEMLINGTDLALEEDLPNTFYNSGSRYYNYRASPMNFSYNNNNSNTNHNHESSNNFEQEVEDGQDVDNELEEIEAELERNEENLENSHQN